MPSVSVIIPCYNQAHYLSSAVHSVFAQTFRDWEIIIVDDGSVDKTREVVAGFTNPRIDYIYQTNQGLSGARNTGIHYAAGEYLTFLDADDMWEPAFLLQCMTVLHTDSSLAGVYTRAFYMDEQGNLLPQSCGIVVPRQSFRTQLLEGGFFPVHAVVIRRNVIHEAGLFDPNVFGIQDWDLWLTVASKHTLQGIDIPLVRYRVVENSMSMQCEKMHRNRLIVLEKHFGIADGDITTWSTEKRRAYGCAYRATAYDYLQQQWPDESWNYLQQAFKHWPALLESPDTFYELACGIQPRGHHGEAHLLDLEAVCIELMTRLENLLTSKDLNLGFWRQVAYGNAWVALTVLNQKAHRWSVAHNCLTSALFANPKWLLKAGFLRWWFGLTWKRFCTTIAYFSNMQ